MKMKLSLNIESDQYARRKRSIDVMLDSESFCSLSGSKEEDGNLDEFLAFILKQCNGYMLYRFETRFLIEVIQKKYIVMLGLGAQPPHLLLKFCQESILNKYFQKSVVPEPKKYF